ncbi:EamA family transporter RarD [uncultured Dialister sp.]|uniref:EamA family transporter RarD n=1 Tax=uncultured Dialister sp. TaxID=278064 RepID=UPI0026DA9E5B|nr:EamA family transporter RarD [uncultured Dialister sp.]
MVKLQNRRKGLWAAIACYIIWGILPLYWKLLSGAGAYEILAHRIIWSFVFMTVLLLFLGMGPLFRDTVKSLCTHRIKGALMIAASFLITANWCIFIWAVTHDHIVDSSFGYYINPLVNVFLGVLLFHEKLSKLKWLSIIIALIGIIGMSVELGRLPLVSVSLAFTFALYGAAKKKLHINPFVSITLETLLVLPLALWYAGSLYLSGEGHFLVGNAAMNWLFIGAGIVTATPLVLFSSGANNLPLNVLGFCQYLSPSLSLLLGIFLYHEPFNVVQITGFSVIWISLVLFTISDFREQRHMAGK